MKAPAARVEPLAGPGSEEPADVGLAGEACADPAGEAGEAGALGEAGELGEAGVPGVVGAAAGPVKLDTTASRTEPRTSGIRNSATTELTASTGSAKADLTSSWKPLDMCLTLLTNLPSVRAAPGSRLGPRTIKAITPTRKSFSGLRSSTSPV